MALNLQLPDEAFDWGEAIDAEMVSRLVAAAEKGFPGDRFKQIQQVAAHAALSPIAMTGVFLRALNILAERAEEEALQP
jgi:hypothetical protein